MGGTHQVTPLLNLYLSLWGLKDYNFVDKGYRCMFRCTHRLLINMLLPYYNIPYQT